MREFWRKLLKAVLRTEPAWSKEEDYSPLVLTEVERMDGGKSVGFVPCVLYMRKCKRCNALIKVQVPRSTSPGLIDMVCYGRQHRAIIVAYTLNGQE